MPRYPERIVCLTQETTETLYLLAKATASSGCPAIPSAARGAREAAVSAFITPGSTSIAALEPDLVLAFSDLQADLAAELVRRGLRRRHVQPAAAWPKSCR